MKYATPYIWKNGKFISWKDSCTHDMNHSLHYGGGTFEGIRFYSTQLGPKIFKLETHVDRLFYSAKFLGIVVPFSEKEICDVIIELVKKSGEKSGYIRPLIYSGEGNMKVYPLGAQPEIVISVLKWGKYIEKEAVNVKIPQIKRADPRTTNLKAKLTGNYAINVVVSQEIEKEGFDEALFLSINNNITEGAGENIFFIKGNNIYTPKICNILPGITRQVIIQFLKEKFDIIVIEKDISVESIGDYDEVFFTGTAAEVTLIQTITTENGERFHYKSSDEESLSKQIQKCYMKIVQGEDSKYHDWLY